MNFYFGFMSDFNCGEFATIKKGVEFDRFKRFEIDAYKMQLK